MVIYKGCEGFKYELFFESFMLTMKVSTLAKMGLAALVASNFSIPSQKLAMTEQKPTGSIYATKDEETPTEYLVRLLEEGSKRLTPMENNPVRNHNGIGYQRIHLNRRQMPAHQDHRQERAAARASYK